MASLLLQVRALMLERLGRHREALALYVHTLRDLPLAEQYCDRVYAGACVCWAALRGCCAGAGPGCVLDAS
jgi:hypothetical protein